MSGMYYDEDFHDDDMEDSSNPIHENVHEFVKECVSRFFSDKQMHCGGKVPKYVISDKAKITLVMSISLLDSVDIAYQSLKNLSEDDIKMNGDVAPDVKLVTESLSVISKAGVPQQFAGGMLLMYLEIVKGVKINV